MCAHTHCTHIHTLHLLGRCWQSALVWMSALIKSRAWQLMPGIPTWQYRDTTVSKASWSVSPASLVEDHVPENKVAKWPRKASEFSLWLLHAHAYTHTHTHTCILHTHAHTLHTHTTHTFSPLHTYAHTLYTQIHTHYTHTTHTTHTHIYIFTTHNYTKWLQ